LGNNKKATKIDTIFSNKIAPQKTCSIRKKEKKIGKKGGWDEWKF
jgi:hypothetical protein